MTRRPRSATLKSVLMSIRGSEPWWVPLQDLEDGGTGMAEVRLAAQRREGTGKGAARRVRATGRVPGIVYGHGMQPLPIQVDRREFVTALHTEAGMNVLLDLDIDGETTLVLTKELQRNPVRGTLLHADFIKIDRMQEVEVEVPVALVGEAPGAVEGGVLEHPLTAVLVRCRATDVPEGLQADVSSLGMGDSLRVSDLPAGANFEILTDPDTVIASITAPVSEAELEALEAGAGVVHEPSDEEVAEGQAEAAAEAGDVVPDDASEDDGAAT